jgi:hypothetical protein
MKPYTTAASIVFALVAIAQLLRFALGWTVIINGISIPPWCSAVACLIAATLAIMVRREARQ